MRKHVRARAPLMGCGVSHAPTETGTLQHAAAPWLRPIGTAGDTVTPRKGGCWGGCGDEHLTSLSPFRTAAAAAIVGTDDLPGFCTWREMRKGPGISLWDGNGKLSLRSTPSAAALKPPTPPPERSRIGAGWARLRANGAIGGPAAARSAHGTRSGLLMLPESSRRVAGIQGFMLHVSQFDVGPAYLSEGRCRKPGQPLVRVCLACRFETKWHGGAHRQMMTAGGGAERNGCRLRM
jgi:hypothetical protein